mmetsp:Transcript_18021/g.33839  ORF Transcript_18021/g.33839 Transcript_18021/m.33839 type:complete len:596 (-) Transcript_18021:30-1817(-)
MILANLTHCDVPEDEPSEVMLLQTQRILYRHVHETRASTATLLSEGLQGHNSIAMVACLIGFGVLAILFWGVRRYFSSEAMPKPAQSAMKWGIYGILFTQTLNALATMVVLPTLPFFAMTLGASALEVSLMNSAYNLAQMFCSPLMGAVSDRLGRKRVMLAGIFLQMLCNAAMSQSHTLIQLMVARMAVGLALSTGPVEMAYIMDFLDSQEELSRVLSLQRVMTSAGALAGPLVAHSFGSLSFQKLCLGVVAVNVLNLLIGFVLWEDVVKEKSEPKPRDKTAIENNEEQDDRSFQEHVSAMFTNGSACSLLLVSFVYALGFAIGDGPEMVFFKERFSFGKDQACLFYLVTNASTLVCSAWVPALLTNFGALTLCVVGSLGGALCTLLLVLGPVASWVPYAFGVSMVGLFGTMIGMGFMHLVREYCPEDLMGTMLGLQSSLNGAAGAMAPPLGGVLYRLNIFFPFLCSSAACALTGLLYETTLHKEKEPEPAKPQEAVVHRKKAKLKRLSTFGRPIYHDKSFIVQVYANELSVEINVGIRYLYQRMRERLREENVRGGMKPVATVHGPLASSIEEEDERKTMGDIRRVETMGRLAE